MTTFTWTGGSGNWDTAGDWNPLGPPTASSIATINGTTTEFITVNNAPAIGGAAGANLTVAKNLAIEEGSLGIGGLGSLDAASIRIAAPKGSTTPTNGVLFFLGSGTIGATVKNNGTIKAEGAAGSTVEFERSVIGNGHGNADISGGGTLEFAKKVVQNIDFGTGGGTLNLLDPTAFNLVALAASPVFRRAIRSAWPVIGVFDTLTNPTSGTTHLTLLLRAMRLIRSTSSASSRIAISPSPRGRRRRLNSRKN